MSIESDFRKGKKIKDIANKYGISESAVYRKMRKEKDYENIKYERNLNIIKRNLINLSKDEKEAIAHAKLKHVPYIITGYMDYREFYGFDNENGTNDIFYHKYIFDSKDLHKVQTKQNYIKDIKGFNVRTNKEIPIKDIEKNLKK